MFTKIDKKILIILIIAVVVILLTGFVIYKYTSSSEVKVQNSAGGAQTEINTPQPKEDNSQQVQIDVGGIDAQKENEKGIMSVCLDKCGDNICQKTDPNCSGDNNLNCICPETPQECSQDCK